jgi:endoglucanase
MNICITVPMGEAPLRCIRFCPLVLVVIAGLATVMELRAAPRFVGVNLAGAEFTPSQLPGIYNTHYTYPTTAEVDYFTGKGMNIIRLPFRWERLQHSLDAAFDSAEFTRLHNFVNYVTSRGTFVILDPHNYGRYYNTNVIGTPQLPITALSNFWSRLATIYRTNGHLVFGLMNEPHDMSTQVWRDAANAAIASIRAVGATNLILVPGNGWSIAHDWHSSWYGTPNATVMLTITDPANNYAFEVHDYFDDADSGQVCDPQVGVQRLITFTSWCRANGRQGFYGEFGVSTNASCLIAMSNMLHYVRTNSDVWLGWTYWAAGPWWGNYGFSIEPSGGKDRPQMDMLEPFLPLPQPRLSFRWLSDRRDAYFSFPVQPGYAYQPQASASLQPDSWTNHGIAYTGGTFTANILMQIRSNEHRFYRVQVQRAP